MSLNAAGQPIDPFKLLSESISQVSPVYLSLLLINIPSVFLSVAQDLLPLKASGAISLVYVLVISPILGAIAMSFVARYLQQQTMDLAGAANKAFSKSGQLILGALLYLGAVFIGLFLLLIPGLYISVAWGFVLYAIVLENYSAIDGIKYSQRLVKGRWWTIFGSMLVGAIFLIPSIILSIIFTPKTGAINSGAITGSLVSSVIALICTPPLQLYFVKLYLRIKETSNLTPVDSNK
jgi:hypothetical protein